MSPVVEACGGVDYGSLACPKRGPFWCTYPRLRNSLFSKELDCAKRAVQNSAMKFGYARCSTEEQNLSLQIDALRAVGCEKVYEDAGVSGGAELTDRPGLDQCLLEIGEGDTLVVWKLDRLGRSLSFLIGFMDRCGKDGIEFKSLTEGIDTTTAGGKLIYQIMGALAEFERSLIVERTKAGMQAAVRRGKHVGRPRALSEEQIIHARKVIGSGGETIGGMASVLGVSRNTLARALRSSST